MRDRLSWTILVLSDPRHARRWGCSPGRLSFPFPSRGCFFFTAPAAGSSRRTARRRAAGPPSRVSRCSRSRPGATRAASRRSGAHPRLGRCRNRAGRCRAPRRPQHASELHEPLGDRLADDHERPTSPIDDLQLRQHAGQHGVELTERRVPGTDRHGQSSLSRRRRQSAEQQKTRRTSLPGWSCTTPNQAPAGSWIISGASGSVVVAATALARLRCAQDAAVWRR